MSQEVVDYLERTLLDWPTGIFVDFRAVESAHSALDIKVDFEKFLAAIQAFCPVASAGFYWGYPPNDSATRYMGWLRSIGWRTWWPPATTLAEGRPCRACRQPVAQPTQVPAVSPACQLTADALLAEGTKQFVLFTKGRDFEPLFKALRGLGRRTVAVTWDWPSGMADANLDLRRVSQEVCGSRAGAGSPQ